MDPHELTDGQWLLGLPGTGPGAWALLGAGTWRFKAKGLLDLAGGGGGEGALESRRARRVGGLTRRVGIGVGVGVGDVGEGLAGGGAAGGDEDLVCG